MISTGLTILLTGVAAFAGALGAWFIGKVHEWWTAPKIKIKYGKDYPYRAHAFAIGGDQEMQFIRVRVANLGRSTARNCKCYVRDVTLKEKDGTKNDLPTAELMLTNWVPREAGVARMHIPRDLEFLADIAMTMKNESGIAPWRPSKYFDTAGERVVAPIFNLQNKPLEKFATHDGEFIVEVVVVSDNAKTETETIRFSFDSTSHDLEPLV